MVGLKKHYKVVVGAGGGRRISKGITLKVNLGGKGGGDQHTQNGEVMRQFLFAKE